MQELPKEVVPILCEYILRTYKHACTEDTFYQRFRYGLIDVRSLGLTCKRLWKLCAPQLEALCNKYLAFPVHVSMHHKNALCTYYASYPDWRCIIYLRYEGEFLDTNDMQKVFGDEFYHLATTHSYSVGGTFHMSGLARYVRLLKPDSRRVERVLQHMRDDNEREKKKRKR